MHHLLQKHYLKHDILPSYHDFLTNGLQKGHNVEILPDPINHIQEPHCKIYQAQQELGWKQLYYSHMSPAWVTLQNDQYSDVNSLHYYVKVQTIIWQAVLKAWHQWNQDLHPTNHDLEDKSEQLYIR